MGLIKKVFMLLLVTCFVALPQLHAQSGLQISKAFNQYGKHKGAVLVELTNEALGDYDFNLFKSLTITNNPEAADYIRSCLKEDQMGAKKVKQVVANGVLTSEFLELPKKGKLSRLILFNETSQPEQKIILIYIESKASSEELLKFILQKK